MQNKKSHARLIGYYILPILVWASVVFLFSSQTADSSSRLSSGILLSIFNIIAELFETFESLDRQTLLAACSGLFRKTAHVVEYAILAILLLRFFWHRKGGWEQNRKKTAIPFINPRYYKYIATLALGIGYACLDEYRQSFVPGRSSEFRDVCIDTLGLCLGIFLYTVYKRK